MSRRLEPDEQRAREIGAQEVLLAVSDCAVDPEPDQCDGAGDDAGRDGHGASTAM